MADKTDLPMIEDTPKTVSRRDFIIGVIAGGAAVSSGYYLFRAATRPGHRSAAGVGERLLTLDVNGQQGRVDVMMQETLANGSKGEQRRNTPPQVQASGGGRRSLSQKAD